MGPRAAELDGGGLGARGRLFVGLLAAGVLSWLWLGLDPAKLLPRAPHRLVEFFGAALHPTLVSEAGVLPDRLLVGENLLQGLLNTVLFAAAAMSLAIPAGFVLGFLGTPAWWEDDCEGARRRSRFCFCRFLGPLLKNGTRVCATFLRSIHELFWAVLLLAAFGPLPSTGILALFLPFAGTLGKIYAEMVEETPRDAGLALRDLGARPIPAFLFGLLPRALPDMTAYTLYRFECALRSSAVLGFFGFQTLGYFIKLSFDENLYHEVWTYLWGLVLLVVLTDALSGAMRRRFVA